MMIEELRALFAELYAAGCEHENYAYALSDELNIEVDKALLDAFKTDLDNLSLRCKLVSDTEKYTLERMNRRRVPARPFVWYKLRRVPNEIADVIDNLLCIGENAYKRRTAEQVGGIELDIAAAQCENREPEGEPSEDVPDEAAETPQEPPEAAKPEEESEKPQERRRTPRRAKGKARRRKDPKGKAGIGEEPENGNGSASELWDEDEFGEDEAPGDAE